MRLSSQSSTRKGRRLASDGIQLGGDGFAGGGFGAGDNAHQASCNCAGLIGLVRQLAKATLANAGLSARTPIEVSKTNGIITAPGNLRISSASIRPSMPGICMSRMARSKASPVLHPFQGLRAAFRGARNHAPFAGLQRRGCGGWSDCHPRSSRRRSASCGCGPLQRGAGHAASAAKRER